MFRRYCCAREGKSVTLLSLIIVDIALFQLHSRSFQRAQMRIKLLSWVISYARSRRRTGLNEKQPRQQLPPSSLWAMVPQRLLCLPHCHDGMDGCTWMLAAIDARFAMLHILHAGAVRSFPLPRLDRDCFPYMSANLRACHVLKIQIYCVFGAILFLKLCLFGTLIYGILYICLNY